MRIVAPLNPREGERYIELVIEELEIKEINKLYNIATKREGYVNPTKDGEII